MSNLTVTAVITDNTPPQWIADVLNIVSAHPAITLNSIILQNIPANTPKHPVPNGLFERLAESVLYLLVDRSKPKNNVQTPTPLSTSLNAKLVALDEHHSHITQTDVILHFGDETSDTDKLPAATHGIWTFKTHTLKPHVEHALLTRAPLLWVHLWQLPSTVKNRQSHTEARRIGSHSLPTQSFSASGMINYTFASLPEIMCSRLNWLANGHDPLHVEQQQLSTLNSAYPLPTAYSYNRVTGVLYFFKALRLFWQLIWRRFAGKKSLEQWQLGFSKRLAHASDIAVDDYQIVKPAANNIWWADPHVLVENGETHVFFEDMNLNDMVGKISTAVLSENGFTTEPVTALDEPHHLSYPFVFRHQNTIYMIPETASRRTVSLYKAVQFPHKWEWVKNLFEDLDAADTTVFEHDGRWWMFTNGMSHPEVDERDLLWLYYTDDFDSGQWHPHVLNPVVTGVDRARMAGNVYLHDGQLYRPSQYGATRYGYGVNLSKINTLTTTDYQEEVVHRLHPSASDEWLGCHTAVHSDKFTIVDLLHRTKGN